MVSSRIWRGFHTAAAGAGQHGEADEPRDRVRQGREGGVAGGLAAAGAHAVALAQQDQFRSVFQHVKGLEGDGLRAVLDAPSRCAPVPENRMKRSMEKKPRSARFSCPGPNASCSPSARAFSPSR